MRVTIRDVWERIPPMECTGACAPHCTAVMMTAEELALVRERIPSFPSGQAMLNDLLEDPYGYKCPALILGRCAVYDVRPTVCRIFGNAESLPCPVGCQKPKLSREEASEIMDMAADVGGEIVREG
jgi:Fe-S-cluster containining protein